MTDITFAKTRHQYDSYNDFWRLVDLCGYPTCYVDEIDANDASKCYIGSPLNAEWVAGWPDPKARIVLWDIEWRDECPQIPGVEVWAADRWYADKLGVQHVPLGSHKDLAPFRATSIKPSYDFAMLAYMTHRRSLIYDTLAALYRGAPNAWGVERDDILCYTSVLLHVHQHNELRTIAPQRFALAASAKAFLISEQCDDPYPYRPGSDFFQAPYTSLTQSVQMFHSNRPLALDMGASLYYRMCEEFRFDKSVEAAL